MKNETANATNATKLDLPELKFLKTPLNKPVPQGINATNSTVSA
jgi:hypothetical protein